MCPLECGRGGLTPINPNSFIIYLEARVWSLKSVVSVAKGSSLKLLSFLPLPSCMIWRGHGTSLSLSLLFCEVGIIQALPQGVMMRVKCSCLERLRRGWP